MIISFLNIYFCITAIFLHLCVPYLFNVGSWPSCLLHSLCIASVYSDKIIYKHKCLE